MGSFDIHEKMKDLDKAYDRLERDTKNNEFKEFMAKKAIELGLDKQIS